MLNHVQLKHAAAILIIALLIVFVGVFFNSSSKNNLNLMAEKPYEVIKPEKGYIPGTTVSLYKNAPPGFPSEVILENKTLSHSSLVNTPDGKSQTSVSYMSDKSPLEVAQSYTVSLPKQGWKITSNVISKNISVLQASLGEKKLLLTVSPGNTPNATDAMVTLQYTE